RTKREKFSAVADEVEESYKSGQPVLVGTPSIEDSEKMSKLLKARRVPHNVLNAKAHDKEALIVAQAGRLGTVTVATNMAGRGTDIVLGGNAEYMARDEAAKHDIERDSGDFDSILGAFREQCSYEHEKVVELGGLRIVGIERHESRRIDNQLRGRSGRQGDPGESRFYIALEDDLLRLFGGERVQAIMTKLGMEEGESIENSILTKQIEGAQKKVESMHFDIRKQLLSYDNVMNQQREAVYRERDEILHGDDILGRTLDIIEGTLSDLLGHLFSNSEEPDIKGVGTRLKSIFWNGIENGLAKIEMPSDVPAAEERIKSEIKARFDKKVEELGEDTASQIFKFVLLQVLDASWREHLLGLDELRRGIGLRAIGQKDPLIEYQFESYNLFQEALRGVREKVAEYALRVAVVSKHANSSRPQTNESRESLLPGRGPGQEEMAGNVGDARSKPVHKGRKIGRNDPCPCGSGRKYKHCCGREIKAVPTKEPENLL
ncbi:MAG: SEC-C metal-binding domain-containing protein, partial [Synergistaceae bacterium]|nr:SEC-C metal-binding domain-containing protein [Synergistaceae bacterium]